MNEKYIIRVIVATPYKRYNAILEALTNTAQFFKDDSGNYVNYNDKNTVCYMLSCIYQALKDTTYIRRNTKTELTSGFNVVFISNGKDYTITPEGTIDTIEVRGIQSDKVALRYSIEKIDTKLQQQELKLIAK